jgi:membrane protease YdiL (CAAX protease family)
MENTEEQELGGSTIAKFNPFSLLLLVSALFIELYLIGKYLGRDPYANYSILLFTLGFIPIPGLYLLNDKDILDRETKFTKDLWETIKLFGYSFLVFGFLAVIQVLTQLSFRLALSTTDLYFYFLAAGIIEEAFFRMFLLRVFMKYLRSPWGKIVGTIISSVFFMFAHLGAYGTTLPVLLSMLFFGIFLCITYLSFKDITPNMLGHMGYNLYAIGTLLMRI